MHDIFWCLSWHLRLNCTACLFGKRKWVFTIYNFGPQNTEQWSMLRERSLYGLWLFKVWLLSFSQCFKSQIRLASLTGTGWLSCWNSGFLCQIQIFLEGFYSFSWNHNMKRFEFFLSPSLSHFTWVFFCQMIFFYLHIFFADLLHRVIIPWLLLLAFVET